MAKVTGPLQSMSASGAFGGALVFGKSKGHATVRQLVKPSNPKSINQQTARNEMRVASRATWWVTRTGLRYPGAADTDRERLTAITPDSMTWNDRLVQTIIGDNGLNYAAAVAISDAGGDGFFDDWDAANSTFDISIPEVRQVGMRGQVLSNLSGGVVFFHLVFALSLLGLASTPNAVPPNYS
jgi:hypothetical protein